MKLFKSIVLMAAAAIGMSAQAQQWDSQKYPDYKPGNFNPDPESVAFGQQFTEAERTGLCPELRMKRDAARRAKRKAEGEQSVRPDHVHNGATKYFAPVFNQSGGSCGSASRIGYMFTHELNAFRDLDGSKPENYYPTHFVWLHTYGQSGKDEFVQFVGVPNAKTYGGQTHSSLFGYNDESDPDFGWMNGYDKWYSGFFNRMEKPTTNAYSLATEVGREWAKNWLWNHCGDNDFKAGGLIGLGVASGGQWHDIPKTTANDAAGVTGMKYVHEWGVSVDHALTMVGYDDRIEFDLDGNGVYGEVDKDEVGAWIIVNSWGQWCNGGFIYCPYAFAGAMFNNDAAAGKRTFNTNSWWYGELYRVRKNYTPTRTIKVKMDYSRRSELCLSVGVSADLGATKPEKSMNLHHFIWAGDGNYGNGMKEQTGTNSDGKPTYKDTKIAPEVPMLGKWADGKMHYEPMEFGYDLTDLCAGYDQSKPLKLFFMIDSRTKNGSTYAKGGGHLYDLSIIDYAENAGGVETPFVLEAKASNGADTIPCKKQLTWSTIVYGNQLYAPQNPTIQGTTLAWQAPHDNGRTVTGYNIYKDGALVATTQALTYTTQGDGTYSITALYGTRESSKVSVATAVRKQENNVCIDLKPGNGFTIPEVFANKYPKATLEFWINPRTVTNYNNAIGSWGSFMFHCNNGGSISAGWDTNNRVNGVGKLETNKWNHVAVSVNASTMTVLVNGTSVGTASGGSYSGLGGFGNLTFLNGGNNAQDCSYDEIRIWETNHNATAVKNEKDVEFSGELIPDGLLAYYKGDVIYIDGWPYLRDCVGGHHARLTVDDKTTYEEKASTLTLADVLDYGTFSSSTVKITKPSGEIYAGVPVNFAGTYPDAATRIAWDCEAIGVKGISSKHLAATFPSAGTYTLNFTATNGDGAKTFTASQEVTVVNGPEANADFKATASEVSAGVNVTFAPVNPVAEYSYEWSMPGAVVEQVYGVTAAACYEKKGYYNVTLTVTDAQGHKASKTQQVEVKEVAPEPAFVISKPVAMVGDKVLLENVSKYNPTKNQWVLQGTAGNVVINGGTTYFNCDKPGVFDVQLIASNEAGSNATTQERALVVVNADSKNGLSFGQSSRVTATQVPLAADTKAYTIEWWMAPTKLSNYCLGIGEGLATFQIRVGADGKMYVSNKGKECASKEGMVLSNQWHHYAVVVAATSVKFYRDGVAFGTGSTTSGLGEMKNFSIGTSAGDMNGTMDEFRVWSKNLTVDEIKAYANAPIAEPKSTEFLELYYDFNQSGGNVEDRTSHANAGVRTGFGPDGDAWGLSKGVFSLNFDAASAAKDVSSTYLANYKRSFANYTTLVNKSTASRFYAIKSWTLENQTVEGDITTGVHVDKQKSSDFTCTTGWDGFGSLSNHKAFQVVELEAGIYQLSVTFGQHGAAGDSYLVAAAGETLPNGDNLGTALSYAKLSDGAVTFVVPEKQKVALGVLVASMAGQNIFTIQKFTLTRSDLDIREADVPEGIDAVTAVTGQSSAAYDLQGRVQGYGALRPGIYVIGGKKTIIK